MVLKYLHNEAYYRHLVVHYKEYFIIKYKKLIIFLCLFSINAEVDNDCNHDDFSKELFKNQYQLRKQKRDLFL